MTTSGLAVPSIASARSVVSPAGRPRSERDFAYWYPRLQAAADFLTVACGLWVIRRLHADLLAATSSRHGSIGASVAALAVVSLFAQLGAYSAQVAPMNIVETERLLRGIGFAVAIGTVGSLYWQVPLASLAWLAGLAVALLLVVQRDITHLVAGWICRRGYGVRRVLIYGGQNCPQLARLLRNSPQMGKLCVGFVAGRPSPSPPYLTEDSESAGQGCDLEKVAGERRAVEVMVAPSVSQDELADMARECARLDLRLSVILEVPDGRACAYQYGLLGGLPIATVNGATEESGNSVLKRAVDVVGAVLLLVLLSPLYALAAMLVKIDSKGPVFFRHERVGKDAARFFLWKFRSMLIDAAPYERSPASDSDARLTRVGRLLRRLSIDELPQLINVLQGDMSLVGPRPEMPFIVDSYSQIQQQRLKVKPGITGLWQISPARARPIHENMEFDLFYIAHQNFFLDFAILLRTITAVIRGIGAT